MTPLVKTLAKPRAQGMLRRKTGAAGRSPIMSTPQPEPSMSCRIACFGELLLRLSAPGRELLLQTPRFEVHVGGAEANVAVSLARFGHDVRMLGTAPGNALGVAARGELRRHGVDTRGLRAAPGRMGLYFLAAGAGLRPSEVLYDRAGSAFALAAPETYDWPALLAGASWLHVSGVTPALGDNTACAAIDAVQAAAAAGIAVSFDGNFRPTLWAAWDGDPAALLRPLLAGATLAFADHRDIDVVLGPDPDGDASAPHARRFAAAAARAFAAFPRLQRIACTARTQDSVDHHALGALMATRDGALLRVEDRALPGIVDRIGGGDAFAAGVLHGIASGWDDEASLRFGHAAACLKHSVPGDFNLVGSDDVLALVQGGRLDVKR
jgi:2-dehydro-3-deoxygluconokinase